MALPDFYRPRARSRTGLYLCAVLCLLGSVPRSAHAQEVFYPAESNLPALPGGRIRAEQLATRRSPNLIIMGLLERGLPYSGLYRLQSEGKRTAPGGAITYLPVYNPEGLPDALWDGDVVFEDLTGDDRADILIMGNSARDSVAARPVIALYREGTSRIRSIPTLPALYASRFAYRRGVLALAGRGATGLALEVYAVTKAVTPTFTRLAQLPGLEHPSLALGDCDADGDLDLFASGADAAGLPTARLYRNDGATFTPGAVLPGLFRGDASFGDFDGDGAADLAYSGYRYGPGGAEGNVYVYRMVGCVPTPVAVPASMRRMMADFVALEDVTSDNVVDLLVAGLNPPFRAGTASLRLALRLGNDGFVEAVTGQRQAFGNGSATLLTLPTGGPRPAVVGLGLGSGSTPGVWFYTRPEFGQ